MLAVLLVLAYVLAVGFGSGSIGHRMVDGLKVFPQFPGAEQGRPWPYVLARQLAAVALVTATVSVVAALLSKRIAELRARFRRNHAVVFGLGETGLRNALAFRAQRIPTTCVELNATGDAADAANAAGALIIHADATQISTVENTRVERAEWIVCSCPDDATNTRIAAIVVELAARRSSSHTPRVEVHIDNPHLARVLRGPLASLGRVHLHFFNSSQVWARALLDDAGADCAARAGDPSPKIVVLGATALGEAVLVEAARRWHGVAKTNSLVGRATILLVGSGASAATNRLRRRYPALERVCDIHPLDEELEPGGPLDLGGPEWEAIYACVDDQSVNVAAALEAERTVSERTAIIVPTTAAVDALAPLLGGVTRIRTVSLAAPRTSLDLLHDQITDLLARAAHEAYLAQRETEPDFGTRPADRSWNELSPDHVRANRAHAEAVIEQLRAVWYEIEPRYDWDERPTTLAPSAVEVMKELEHARWHREKVAEGWRYGPVRDNATKIHNLLVPWRELSEKERRVDRALVSDRAAVLARAGFRVIRDPVHEQLARQLHEQYAASYEGAPFTVPWEQLPEEKRESNRAAVDHIAAKLARIGCRIVPQGRGVAERFAFTNHEVEELAKLEHERWVAEQERAGIRYASSRDEASLLHPSMVAWDELPEQEREKDREVVRAIPNQLVAVGYAVVCDEPIAESKGLAAKFADVPRALAAQFRSET